MSDEEGNRRGTDRAVLVTALCGSWLLCALGVSGLLRALGWSPGSPAGVLLGVVAGAVVTRLCYAVWRERR